MKRFDDLISRLRHAKVPWLLSGNSLHVFTTTAIIAALYPQLRTHGYEFRQRPAFTEVRRLEGHFTPHKES